MSGPRIIVVDDSRNGTAGTEKPAIFYDPPDLWRHKVLCNNCSVEGTEAFSRLASTAVQGTWTTTWWDISRTLLTANLEFQGSEIAAYFIVFLRSLDFDNPEAPGWEAGTSDLRFFVDHELKHHLPLVYTDYTFQDDFSGRLKLFEYSGLDPDVPHQFQIQWTHNGSRPRVAVGLDSIEFLQGPSIVSSSSNNSTSTATPVTTPSDRKTNVGAIAGAVVGGIAALIAAIILLVICLRRRGQQKTGARRILDPSSSAEVGQISPVVYGRAPSETTGATSMYQAIHKNSVQVPSSSETAGTGSVGVSSPQNDRGVADNVTLPPPYMEDSDGISGNSSRSSSRPSGRHEKSLVGVNVRNGT